MKMFLNIYGDPPNPILAHNPVYGLCLLLFIVIAGVILWAINKPKK